MRIISKVEFLHNVGYGAVMVDLQGQLALAPLVRPGDLPPVTRSFKRFGSIEAQAKAVMSWYNLPGMAIGLIRDNKLVYAKGFGVKDINARQPMTEYTIMPLASPTKMFTGAAIMQLVEAGKLSLDDTAASWVPYFKLKDPRYKDITIRHLLGHKSGIPNESSITVDDILVDPWWDSKALERFIRWIQDEDLTLLHPPGDQEEFKYCDFGYMVLGAVIQEVSGQTYEDYQRQHILDPLRMTSSSFLKADIKPQSLAAPHLRDVNGNPVVYKYYPAVRLSASMGGLLTNVVEMSHWIAALMNDGVYYSRLMRKETFAKFMAPFALNPYGYEGTYYSPGIIGAHYAGPNHQPVPILFSCGAHLGFDTHITMFPEQGLAAIVFVNLKTLDDNTDYAWGICDKLAIQMLNGEL